MYKLNGTLKDGSGFSMRETVERGRWRVRVTTSGVGSVSVTVAMPVFGTVVSGSGSQDAYLDLPDGELEISTSVTTGDADVDIYLWRVS